jgi:integrase
MLHWCSHCGRHVAWVLHTYRDTEGVFMSIRKRQWTTRLGEQKSAWIADYFDQHGKRHIETFARKRDAEARHDKARGDVRSGKYIAPNDTLTVAEAAQQWLDTVELNGMRGDGPAERSTLVQYRGHVKRHIVPRLGRVKLAKLSNDAVKQFRTGLLTDTEHGPALTRATARKVLASLRSLLKAAKFAHVADGVAIRNSGRHRHLLKDGEDYPTPDEIRRLFATTMTARQRALLLTVAMTGLRSSELRGLPWSDVDLQAGELRVRQRADVWGKIGAVKSSAAKRTLPLADGLVEALNTWKLQCPKTGKLGLVFPTRDGAVEHPNTMRHHLERVQRAAAVVDKETGKAKYGLHSFRHFFASWCINPERRGGREMPMKEAQHVLGHASIVMTMDIYGHLFPEQGGRAELAKAASALLAPLPPSSVVPLEPAARR